MKWLINLFYYLCCPETESDDEWSIECEHDYDYSICAGLV